MDKPIKRRQRVRLQPQPAAAKGGFMHDSRWQVLEEISHYGGIQSKPLLARAVYPKNVEATAYYHVRNRALVQEWINQYGAEAIWQRLQVLNFLMTILRITQLDTITQGKDMSWWKWLQSLKGEHPAAFGQLQQAVAALHQMRQQQSPGDEAQAARTWMDQTLQEEWEPPAAFVHRPRFQKEVVSHHADSECRFLTDAGLIQPVLQPVDGQQITCYYLTKRGRAQLAERRGVGVREVYYKPPGSYTTKLSHRLGQNQLRLAISLSAQHAGYAVHQWLDTWEVEKSLKERTVQLQRRRWNPETAEHELEEKTYRVKYWDDIAVIASPDDQNRLPPLICEFDNATEVISSTTTTNTIEHKYRTLGELLRTKAMEEIFPQIDWSQGAWVVTVTTGPLARLQNLYTAAMQVLGNSSACDRYWFARLADCHPSPEEQFTYTIFQAPIWLRGGYGLGNFQVMRPEQRR